MLALLKTPSPAWSNKYPAGFPVQSGFLSEAAKSLVDLLMVKTDTILRPLKYYTER